MKPVGEAGRRGGLALERGRARNGAVGWSEEDGWGEPRGRWDDVGRTTEFAEKHVERLPDGLLVSYVVCRIWVVTPLDALHI